MYNFIFVYICNIYLRFVFVFVFVNMRVYVCFASLINKYRFTLLYFTLCYLCMFALSFSLSFSHCLSLSMFACKFYSGKLKLSTYMVSRLSVSLCKLFFNFKFFLFLTFIVVIRLVVVVVAVVSTLS